jgi:hypothetical protein
VKVGLATFTVVAERARDAGRLGPCASPPARLPPRPPSPPRPAPRAARAPELGGPPWFAVFFYRIILVP